MSKKPYVVGISGGTCSGKTTLTNNIAAKLAEKYRIVVLHMDKYYKWSKIKTIAPITRIEYVEHNHPDSVDLDLLNADFFTSVSDENNDIVLLEGLFAFYLEQFREKLDLKIFVDLKSDERLYRRIKRMINHESLDEIALRYLDTVRYRHEEFVEPTRWYADLVVNGTLDMNLGTEIVLSYIKTQMDC